MDVVFHAVDSDYADKWRLTEVEKGELVLEHIARDNTLRVVGQ